MKKNLEKNLDEENNKKFTKKEIVEIIVYILIIITFLLLMPKIEINPQYNYAKYLIDNNNKFIELMIEFDDISNVNPSKQSYTEETKSKLNKIIKKQQDIIIQLDKNKPNKQNEKYTKVHEESVKGYALFIQGEIMKLESIYNEKNKESYILGMSILNIVGYPILDLPAKINQINNTNYPTKYKLKQ